MNDVKILINNELDIQSVDDNNILMCCNTYSEYILFPIKYLSNELLNVINNNIGNKNYKEISLHIINDNNIKNKKLDLKIDNLKLKFITDNLFVHFELNETINCLPIYMFKDNIKNKIYESNKEN